MTRAFDAATGYRVVPLLDQAGLTALRRLYDELDVAADHPRFISIIHLGRATASEVDRKLRGILGPYLAAHVPDHRAFLALVLSKGARGGEEVEFHQDWTYTDERVHRTVTAWIPLVDVDEHNGAMSMVPGSHTWTTGLRVSNASERDEPTVTLQERFRERSVTVPMTAGQALLYDPAIVHGTPPNLTATPRPAIGIHLAPVGSEVMHFRRDEADRVTGYGIGTDDFYVDAHLGPRDGFRTVEPWTAPVETAEFVPFLDALPDRGGPSISADRSGPSDRADGSGRIAAAVRRVGLRRSR